MESTPVFSHREKEVLKLILTGYSCKEIALSLHISEYTVHAHKRKILEKTACHSCVHLFLYIMENPSVFEPYLKRESQHLAV